MTASTGGPERSTPWRSADDDPSELDRSPARGTGTPSRSDGSPSQSDGTPETVGGEPEPEATEAEARRRGGEAVWRADRERVTSRLSPEGSGPLNPEDAVVGSLPGTPPPSTTDGGRGQHGP